MDSHFPGLVITTLQLGPGNKGTSDALKTRGGDHVAGGRGARMTLSLNLQVSPCLLPQGTAM